MVYTKIIQRLRFNLKIEVTMAGVSDYVADQQYKWSNI